MIEKVHSLEVLTYIVEDHAEQIDGLRKHSHETNKSFVLLEENIRIINSNLEKMLTESVRLADKINILDEDLRDRVNKSKLIQKLASLWPLLLISVVILSTLDYHKISTLMQSASS